MRQTHQTLRTKEKITIAIRLLLQYYSSIQEIYRREIRNRMFRRNENHGWYSGEHLKRSQDIDLQLMREYGVLAALEDVRVDFLNFFPEAEVLTLRPNVVWQNGLAKSTKPEDMSGLRASYALVIARHNRSSSRTIEATGFEVKVNRDEAGKSFSFSLIGNGGKYVAEVPFLHIKPIAELKDGKVSEHLSRAILEVSERPGKVVLQKDPGIIEKLIGRLLPSSS